MDIHTVTNFFRFSFRICHSLFNGRREKSSQNLTSSLLVHQIFHFTSMPDLVKATQERRKFQRTANTVRNALKIKKRAETSIVMEPAEEPEESHLNAFLKEMRKIKDIVLVNFVIIFLLWGQIQAELNSLQTLGCYLMIWISVLTIYVVFRVLVLKKGKRGMLKRFCKMFTRKN